MCNRACASESTCLLVQCLCYLPCITANQRSHQPDYIMYERRNTLFCCFDPASPRISALEIHELIHALLVHVSEQSVLNIQIDRTLRLVFNKFTDFSYVKDILTKTNGITVRVYKHESGEVSTVRSEIARMGTRRVRVANLLPDLSYNTIRTALNQYGEVQSIQEEKWSRKYRYAVANGVKMVTMQLTKHIPSYIIIASYRALTSYDGQPQTCYGCGDTEHMYHVCPKHSGVKIPPETPAGTTWAHIVNPTASTPGTSYNTLSNADSVRTSTQQMNSDNVEIETTEPDTPVTPVIDDTDKFHYTTNAIRRWWTSVPLPHSYGQMSPWIPNRPKWPMTESVQKLRQMTQ